MEILFKYYGIDWIGFIMTLLSLAFLGNKKKVGFLYGSIGNLLWIILNVLIQSVAGVLANIIFIILNVRGYLQWTKSEKIHSS